MWKFCESLHLYNLINCDYEIYSDLIDTSNKILFVGWHFLLIYVDKKEVLLMQANIKKSTYNTYNNLSK